MFSTKGVFKIICCGVGEDNSVSKGSEKDWNLTCPEVTSEGEDGSMFATLALEMWGWLASQTRLIGEF